MSANSLAKAKEPSKRTMDTWEEDHMLHTVLEAEKIRKDPAKMAGVRRAAKRKIAENNALRSLAK